MYQVFSTLMKLLKYIYLQDHMLVYVQRYVENYLLSNKHNESYGSESTPSSQVAYLPTSQASDELSTYTLVLNLEC